MSVSQVILLKRIRYSKHAFCMFIKIVAETTQEGKPSGSVCSAQPAAFSSALYRGSSLTPLGVTPMPRSSLCWWQWHPLCGFLTLILKKLEKITLFSFILSSSCWCLWLISLKLANNNIQLTLEQHGLELRGSTHTWIPRPYDSPTPSSIVWIPRSEPGIRKVTCKLHVGLPSWLSWQRICLHYRRPGLDSGLRRFHGEGTIPTPVFLPREFHGQRSLDR